MIVVMKPNHTKDQLVEVMKRVEEKGFATNVNEGTHRAVIAVLGNGRPDREEIMEALRSFRGVESVTPILKPFKLASLEFKLERTIVQVGKQKIGGKKIQIIAGPCAVESPEVIAEIVDRIKSAKTAFFRGGAFKPRTSPYAFRGHGEKGLKWMAELRKKTGQLIVTEVMDPSEVEVVCKYADILQVGTRNMQNFRLLTAVGETEKPVILKRGMSATIKEFLMSAEYILSEGNENVILCERGIRTFETETRNTLDISAIPVLKSLTHLPVIVDPSHAAGRADIIPELCLSAVAVGADGLLVEVHVRPEEAMSDGPQSLLPDDFVKMVNKCRRVALAIGRSL